MLTIDEYSMCNKEIEGVAEYWGDKMPMLAMEEAGELIQALSKMERYNTAHERMNLIEEIGDMTISIGALTFHYGIEWEEIAEYIFKKLNRTY